MGHDKAGFIFIILPILITFSIGGAFLQPPSGLNYKENTPLTKEEKVKLEAEYLYLSQYKNPDNPAFGAINNIYAAPTAKDPYGEPTWIVPREMSNAILGLLLASAILPNDSTNFIKGVQWAADYLIKVQDKDGAWFDQYSYVSPTVHSKSPTQTAEVMIAFYKLGYKPSRYEAMKKGALFLLGCQNVLNKKGIDDGPFPQFGIRMIGYFYGVKEFHV